MYAVVTSMERVLAVLGTIQGAFLGMIDLMIVLRAGYPERSMRWQPGRYSLRR